MFSNDFAKEFQKGQKGIRFNCDQIIDRRSCEGAFSWVRDSSNVMMLLIGRYKPAFKMVYCEQHLSLVRIL